MQTASHTSFGPSQRGFAPAIVPTPGHGPHTNVFLALEELGTAVTFEKNAALWEQGGSNAYVYRIVSGCIRIVRLMEDGRRHINEFLVPGDWLGFEPQITQDTAAEAVCSVTLRRYAKRGVDALVARDIGVAGWRLEQMAEKLCAAQDRMLTLGRRTAPERIAGFLLDIEARTGKDRNGIVALPMCRSDVGDYLGMTLETACRVMARLQRAAAIRLSPAGFSIRDRAALQACASASL
jgi:CRP/FNR family transcriptional regulator, nitrogen fixation regulation protein